MFQATGAASTVRIIFSHYHRVAGILPRYLGHIQSAPSLIAALLLLFPLIWGSAQLGTSLFVPFFGVWQSLLDVGFIFLASVLIVDILVVTLLAVLFTLRSPTFLIVLVKELPLNFLEMSFS